MAYWRDHLPAIERLGAMVSAYFGVKWGDAADAVKPGEWTDEDLARFAAEADGRSVQ